jgi:predicted methyltransferase MtxX (methanogen marker protein 4)
MAIKKSLSQYILQLAKKKRATIGIAILKTNPTILRSLQKAKHIANVIIYGKKISGFKNIEGKGLSLGVRMMQDFKNGTLDQLVRGQVEDLAMVEEAKKLFGISPNIRRIHLSLMQDAFGREFFLTGISNPDLQTLEEKIRIATETAKWVQSTFKIKPKIAVMATCRPGSYGKDPVMSQTFDEAEATVKHLIASGYFAKNVHIELEDAVTFANIIVPARGTIGCQMWRSMIYFGNNKVLALPTYFPGKLIYEDDSRNEQDWFPHIAFAAALSNLKK